MSAVDDIIEYVRKYPNQEPPVMARGISDVLIRLLARAVHSERQRCLSIIEDAEDYEYTVRRIKEGD